MLPGLEPMISMLKQGLEDEKVTKEEKAKMERSIKAIENISEASSQAELNQVMSDLIKDLQPKG